MLNACLRSRQGECGNVLVTVYQQCVITLTCFSHYFIILISNVLKASTAVLITIFYCCFRYITKQDL